MIALRDDRDPACREAGRWAKFYAGLGLVPLPSRADRKMPALRGGYRRFLYGEPARDGWFGSWWTPNIQVVCGRPGGIAVVDLDGAEARRVWGGWRRDHGGEPTWTVRTGSGNYQLWFRIPGEPPCRWRQLWGRWDAAAGGWAKHEAIELLGAGRLAMAPPSLHPDTGRPYEWAEGRSPLDLDEPAELPAWVAAMPSAAPPRRGPKEYPVPPEWRLPAAAGTRPGTFSRRVVIAAMTADQKAGLARSWGLRLCGALPGGSGWLPCRAIGREDRTPSAGFHAEKGLYSEPFAGPGGAARLLTLFDLGAALGPYPTWQACCDDLGRRLGLGLTNPRQKPVSPRA